MVNKKTITPTSEESDSEESAMDDLRRQKQTL